MNEETAEQAAASTIWNTGQLPKKKKKCVKLSSLGHTMGILRSNSLEKYKKHDPIFVKTNQKSCVCIQVF